MIHEWPSDTGTVYALLNTAGEIIVYINKDNQITLALISTYDLNLLKTIANMEDNVKSQKILAAHFPIISLNSNNQYSVSLQAKGLGGWEFEIYSLMTQKWCEENGLTNEKAKIVGQACDGIDYGYFSFPIIKLYFMFKLHIIVLKPLENY